MPLWVILLCISASLLVLAGMIFAAGRADDASDELADQLANGDWPHVPPAFRKSAMTAASGGTDGGMVSQCGGQLPLSHKKGL